MTQQAESTGTTDVLDREAIRADLERTRQEYHALLASLTREQWQRTSGNPAWPVGALMWHLAWNVGFFADGVKRSQAGKGFNPPRALADIINTWTTRLGSRRATKASVATKYDEGHAKLLAALDGVRDDDWSKGARFFGEYTTVAGQFRGAREHWEEHRADITKALGAAV
jgi:hypothetical protein